MPGGGEEEGHRARCGADGERMDNRPVGKVAVVGYSAGGGLCFVGVCLPAAKSFFVRLGKIVYFCIAFYSVTDRFKHVRL